MTALEADPRLPGAHTRLAPVHLVPDINGPGLLEALVQLRKKLPSQETPVLFLTNDNMVRIVGAHWPLLRGLYHLSWSDCRENVLRLLDKGALEAHCSTHNLPYPKNWMLQRREQLDQIPADAFDTPLIAKPTQPLSGFKVRRINSKDQLQSLVDDYPTALPFLVQQWVPGGDDHIFFTALYLDNGRILASFDGRKLASHPPAMGQTTVAESVPDPRMHKLAERFFAPLHLSGPVSLEAKIDHEGRFWIIEPTLGRTDYWLDVCVANGVNLPLIEFLSQKKAPVPACSQTSGTIWFDTERSPLSYLRLHLNRNVKPTHDTWRPRFAYWDRTDPLPSLVALVRLFTSLVQRTIRKLRQMVR
ncbi:hypothetical protein LQ956_08740 [Ectothiorhodospira sp. A-7Y]|nr:hypothetical protein [Ectothiorhodospira lacustris]